MNVNVERFANDHFAETAAQLEREALEWERKAKENRARAARIRAGLAAINGEVEHPDCAEADLPHDWQSEDWCRDAA